MSESPQESAAPAPPSIRRERGCLFYLLLVLATALLAAGLSAGFTIWWVKRNLDARPLEPVQLTEAEHQAVEAKLRMVKEAGESSRSGSGPQQESAEPVVPDNRRIIITERELNGMLSHNTTLGDKVYIDLEANRISARSRFPVPPDVPVLGGRLLRSDVLIEAAMVNQELDVRIADVQVGGLAVPNPWIGNLKHRNLVTVYRDDPLLRAFAEGIESFSLEKDRLVVTLAP